MSLARKIFGRRRWRIVLGVILVLIAIRLSMPYIIRWYVNEELNEKVKEYDFHIGDVDVWLIRGAFEIEDVVVTKVGGKAPVPFLNVDRLDISLYWKKLFKGFVVAELYAEHPVVNLVHSKQKAWIQTGAGVQWIQLVKNMMPIRIDMFEIEGGEIHFYNYDLLLAGDEKEPGHVYVKELYAVARNLTNSDRISKSMVASFEAKGMAMDQAKIETTISLDPFSKAPTFDLDLEMYDLQLSSLDKMMKTYAAFDIERGTFSLAMEVASDEGKVTGYMKPVFKDLEVFRVKEDVKEDKDTGLEAIWETVVGSVAMLFKNQPKDQVATRVKIEGKIEDPDKDYLGIIVGILHNAFIRALLPQLEHSVKLDK